MSGRLDGQVALVTGGARGIGLAIVQHLLSQGATVAAGYSRDGTSALALDDEHPDRVSIHKGNIGAVEDCDRVVSEVIERHGKIDILVNNAGITADRTVRKMGSDEWDRVIGVNLSGAI
jgi:acetoacetyl-CoA reductase